MKKLISLISLLTLVFCGQIIASPSNEAAVTSSAYEVIQADFGLFYPPESGKPQFVPAKVVPLIPNQGYGWVMLLRTDKPKIKWREEFTLPEKPDTWGDPESLGTRSVSIDGRVSITEREVSSDRGIISNFWAVVPGDPAGRYIIRVFVDDALAGVFGFDVQ